MAGYDGRSFFIEWRWKEEVIYWEGNRGFLFDAGWGVEPPVLAVPSARIWDTVVPEWLRGRREEVVSRLDAHSGHEVVDDDAGYNWDLVAREGPEAFRILMR